MKQIYTVAQEGLTVINGELVRVEFLNVKVLNGHIIYETAEHGVLTDIVTYQDIPSFEQGITYTINVEVCGNVSEDGKLPVYTMKDGEPVIVYEDTPLVYKGGVMHPILKEGFYANRSDCLRENTYVEVKADGTKVEHTGILKKIRLTDEQKTFLNEVMIPAFAKAQEMGIGFVTDYKEQTMAYNQKNFRRPLFDYYGDADDLKSASLEDMELCITSGIAVISDESVIYDEEE